MIKEVVPFFSCVATPDSMAEAIKTYPETYIQNPDGSVLKHVRISAERSVRLQVKSVPKAVKDALPGILKAVPEINFLPAGKIPHSYFEQIVQFFREVIKQKKAQFEAHAWILWTPEDGYFISIPEQTVGTASVSFTYDKAALPDGAKIIVDIHSHNSMGAFYSGTDDNNDKTGIYYSGVVGKLTDTSFDFVFRFNLLETKLEAKLEDVFELPVKPEVIVPQEWVDKVKLNVPQTHYRGSFGPSVHTTQHWQNKGAPQVDRPFQGDRRYDFSGKNRTPKDIKSQALAQGVSEETIARWNQEAEQFAADSGLTLEEINRRFEAAGGADLGQDDLFGQGQGYVERDGNIIDMLSGEVLGHTSRGSLRQASVQTSGEIKEADKAGTLGSGTPKQSTEDDRQSDFGTQGALAAALIGASEGEYDYYAAQYGELVSGAKEDIDVALHDIKNCDEALHDVIRQAYEMLSEKGKNELMQQGVS